MDIEKIKQELKEKANPEKSVHLQRFFKTGKGEYGEGDVFLGLNVPTQRKIAKKYSSLNLNDLQDLLDSKYHEHRLISLFILINKYNLSNNKKEIFDFYLNNAKKVNNWDLVDCSAHHIVGDFLSDKDKKILYELAQSDNLWEKRISIISTFYFIRKEDFEDTLKISEILLNDSHDLIHKAVGWMLREVGKRNEETEEEFLKKHYRNMPRTMLRYAIERFEEGKRKKYLRGEI